MAMVFALAISGIVLFGASAKGDDFTFSFTEPIGAGSTPGTVTGEILGLTNNTTSAAAQVLIESYPAAIASVLGLAPIDATLWNWQIENSFTEVGGIVTQGGFYGIDCLTRYGCEGDVFALGTTTDSGNYNIIFAPYPPGVFDAYYATAAAGGFASANIQPLGSSPQPPRVPEPSTLGLVLTGLVGLMGGLRRWS
jgi:hypothetical protein